MSPVRLIAPAKLTLSLRVTGVRDDGLHLIDAEMVTLDLHDTIELREWESGIDVAGPAAGAAPVDATNLAVRALAASGRTASLRIDKHVPAGAGLGGGSADAAAVLRWAGIDDRQVALALGADVVFCLVGGRARVRGVGELIEPQPFVERSFTLVTPGVFCSTPAVYRRWDELGGPTDPSGNDLTPAALSVAPELAAVRDRLGDDTRQTPRLAGSGSTWFVDGEFPGPGRTVVRSVPADWRP